MAGISSLGVGSGLNLSELLDQMSSIEQQRLTPFTKQQTKFKSQLTAWGVVKSSVAKLDSAAQALQKASEISTNSVSSTNKAFTASVTAKATAGNYQIAVKDLASGHSVQSTHGVDKNATVASGGTTITITQGPITTPVALDAGATETNSFTVTLGEGNHTLEEVRDAINKENKGVTAEIVYDGNGKGYISMSSKETGANSAFAVSVSSNAASDEINNVFATENLDVISRGKDANITVNGIDVFSSTNTFKDALQGISITVNEKSATEEVNGATVFKSETLAIGKDTKELKAAITAYVDAFNEVQATISNQTKFVPGKAGEELSASNGDLMGNTAIRNLQNQLRSQVTRVQDGAFSTLNSLGITLKNDMSSGSSVLKLTIDDKKLDEALKTNTAGVVDFFVGDGKTTGFATQSASQLKQIMDGDTGLFKTQENSINTMLKRIERDIEQTTTSIEANIARTRKEFEALDKVMAEMNSTSTYLAQQLSSLSQQSKQ